MIEKDKAEPIRRLSQQLQRLSSCAAECSLNHSYYRVHGKGREIPLLDCDFVWSSLRVSGAMSQLARPADTGDRDIPALGNQIAAWSGPHTMRHLMDGMARGSREFAIPPGAYAELLRRKQDLFGDLSSKSIKLLKRFDHYLQAPEPMLLRGASKDADASGGIAPDTIVERVSAEREGAIVTRSSAEGTVVGGPVVDLLRGDLSVQMAAGLRNEISDLDSMYDDADLLGRVLDSARQVSDWFGSATDEILKSHRVAFNQLDGSRPEHSLNNFADAINITALVWMFNSPNREVKLQRPPTPVLVTNTAVLPKLQVLLPLPNPEQEALLLQQPLYLLMSQSFNEVNATAAEVENDATVFCNHAADVIAAARQVVRGGSTSVVPMRRLKRHLLSFVERWSVVLDPLRRYPMLDQTSRHNALFSPEIDRMLHSLGSESRADTPANTLKALRDNLHDRFKKRDIIREVLLDVTGSPASAPQAPGSDPYRNALFDITLVPLDRRTALLKNQRPGESRLDEAGRRGPPEGSRFVVSLTNAPRLGALLIADFAVGAADAQLSVRWTHEADLGALLPALVRAAKALAAVDGATTLDVGLFGMDEPIVREFAAADVDASRDLRAECTARDYVELVAGEAAVYADIEPLLGQERQLGVTAPFRRWTKGFIRAVHGLAADLAAPLPQEHVAWMISEIVRALPRTEH